MNNIKVCRYFGALLTLAVFALPPNLASAQIEEIVVTARKRDETALEIPISVTALSQEALNDRGINNPRSERRWYPELVHGILRTAATREVG